MGEPIELHMLERAECLRLLAGQSVGRVVFTEAALPAAQPVNYAVDDAEVVFRTERGGKLAAALAGAVVAFEVDEIDPRTHTGWSVLGVGEAYEVRDPVRLAALAHRVPRSWMPRATAHTIAVPLQVLTGRRLAVANWVSDALCAGPL